MAPTRLSQDRSDGKVSVDKMEAGALENEHQFGDGVLSADDAKFLEEFTEEKRKKVVRKVDVWHSRTLLGDLLLTYPLS